MTLSPALLEVGIIVLTIACFAIMELYTLGCKKI
jgi:hypothetical protein